MHIRTLIEPGTWPINNGDLPLNQCLWVKNSRFDGVLKPFWVVAFQGWTVDFPEAEQLNLQMDALFSYHGPSKTTISVRGRNIVVGINHKYTVECKSVMLGLIESDTPQVDQSVV
jgi:hypothetical protein